MKIFQKNLKLIRFKFLYEDSVSLLYFPLIFIDKNLKTSKDKHLLKGRRRETFFFVREYIFFSIYGTIRCVFFINDSYMNAYFFKIYLDKYKII